MAGTILIVDDDAAVRDTTRLALAREGYRILTATDGHTAMELMAVAEHADEVCALICDLDMPKMDGKELVDCFRKEYPDIPIIVLSGASDAVFLDGIVQEGVCDWLRKPVTREALLEKVGTAVSLHAFRRQHK